MIMLNETKKSIVHSTRLTVDLTKFLEKKSKILGISTSAAIQNSLNKMRFIEDLLELGHIIVPKNVIKGSLEVMTNKQRKSISSKHGDDFLNFMMFTEPLEPRVKRMMK